MGRIWLVEFPGTQRGNFLKPWGKILTKQKGNFLETSRGVPGKQRETILESYSKILWKMQDNVGISLRALGGNILESCRKQWGNFLEGHREDNLEIKGGKFLESKEEMSSNTSKKLIFEEIF